jgi:hypothetical protein
VDQPQDPIWARLEDQIEWYDSHSSRNQRAFKRSKYVEIVAAAAIPVVTGYGGVPRLVPAILGGLVLVVEAVLHLNQYQQNWRTYRATAEGLLHEKFLYLAGAAPYAGPDPRAVLAQRVEALVSQENAHWVSAQEHAELEKVAATT